MQIDSQINGPFLSVLPISYIFCLVVLCMLNLLALLREQTTFVFNFTFIWVFSITYFCVCTGEKSAYLSAWLYVYLCVCVFDLCLSFPLLFLLSCCVFSPSPVPLISSFLPFFFLFLYLFLSPHFLSFPFPFSSFFFYPLFYLPLYLLHNDIFRSCFTFYFHFMNIYIVNSCTHERC